MTSARVSGRALTAAIAIGCCLGLGGVAQGQVIISQLYGGGNNAGSLFNSDFIELYNSGGSPVDLSTWSVHYQSSTGTTWTKLNLVGNIPANGYFLLRTQAVGTTYGIIDVPSPDQTSTFQDLSATTGKVVLLNSTGTLTGGGCPPTASSGTIQDYVGYGTAANCSEPTGTPSLFQNNAPAPDNRNAIIRRLCGTGDGNNNGSDFFVALPNPHNSGTAASANIGAWASGSPSNVRAGDSTLLTVVPRNCTNGAVLGATVNVNLSSIGLSNPQVFVDDGTSGDEISGDGTYSYLASIPGATTTGVKTLQATVTSGANSGGCILPLMVTASGGPANDSCRTALAIAPTGTPGTSGSYGAGGVSQAGNLTGAQAEYNASMTNFLSSSGFVSMNGAAMRRGLWYTCIGTGTTMTAELCATTPTFDNIIQILCGTCDGLSVVSAGDDECGSSQARATWCSTAGQTYYVWVASFTTGATTNAISLKITDNGTTCTGQRPCTVCTPTCVGGSTDEGETAPGIAVNDGCDASSINPSTAQGFTDVTVGGTVLNVCGTLRAVGASSSTAGTVDNDWYRFQAGSTDSFSATATGQLPLTIQLRQLSGTGTCATNTLVSAGSSDRCATASISTSVTAGNWYALKVFPNLPSTTGAAGNNSGFYIGATSNRYVATMQLGAPPANDVCGANAGSFTIAGTGGTASANSNNATDDAGLPSSACPAGSKDVWYYFTPSTSGNWLVGTCGTSYDTIVNVYSGACGALTEVGCNDDSTQCTGGTSEVRVNLTAATLYRIRIASKSGSTGAYTVSVQASPVNDDCAMALDINTAICPPPTVGYGGSFQQSNSSATNDGTASCAASSIRDLWYTFTPAVSGVWTVETCGTGATIDTVISWYTGTCGSLVETDCNDNAAVACTSAATHSRITPTLTAGSTYYMRLATNGTVAGTILFALIPPGPPGNDACVGAGDPAFTIPSVGGTVSGNVRTASSEGNAPMTTCQSATPGQRDMFYYFTPDNTGCTWNISLCGCPVVDTAISIGTLCPTALVSNQLACDDDGCGTFAGLSRLSNQALTPGTLYIIRVSLFGATTTGGPFTMTVSPAPPANDTCATATSLTTSGGSASVPGNNTCATDDGLVPSCGATSKDVWWTFTTTASQAGNWRINTCGSAIDTIVTVYSGACPGVEIPSTGCNDDATTGVCNGSTQSEVVVSLAASTTYKIRVASKGATAGGAITLNVTAEIPPANDDCTTASTLSISGTCPSGTATGSNQFAAAALDGTQPAMCETASKDVFYTVTIPATPAGTNNWTFDTCTAGVQDTVLQVLSSCVSGVDLGCNDDTAGCGDGTQSKVTVSLLAGAVVKVRVASKGAAATGGTFTLTVKLVPPANDTCVAAMSVSEGSYPWSNICATTDGVGWTASTAPPAGCDATDTATNANSDVWFLYTATCTATTTVDTCGPTTGGALGDTVVVIYPAGCVPANATKLACDDDFDAPDTCATGGTLRSVAHFAATKGTQYLIRVGSFSATAQGVGMLNISQPADTTPPSITTCAGDQSADADANCQAAVPDFTSGVVATDNCLGALTVEQSPTAGTLVTIGDNVITLTVKDAANNTSTPCMAHFFVNDVTPPTLTPCPADIGPVPTDPGQPTAVVNWTAPTASDNCPGVMLTSTHNPGDAFPVGVTSVTYTANDGVNPPVMCTFSVTVVDSEFPEFDNCPKTIMVDNDAGLCTAVVSWPTVTATDNAPGVTVMQTQGLASGSAFPVGTTHVHYDATDASNNVTVCDFDVIVTDVEDPVIHDCPGNIAAGTDAPNCSAVVSWTAPTATDNCAVQSFTSDHNPGDTFPLGPTTVTYTATDVHGRTKQCSFTVTVTDDDPPTISGCPGNITSNTNAPNCAAVVSWVAPTASDNCGGASIMQTQGPPSGSTFANGSTTTIEYTATDGVSLTALCSFTVHVVATPDVNNDSVVNSSDVGPFVQVLIGTDVTPLHVYRSDTNCDGVVNGLDIPGMVDALIP